MDMSVGTLLSVEDYLNTSYSPDMEYRDGVLVERNVGEKEHARLQALLTIYFGNHEEEWNVVVYTELRVRVREKWYPIPDVCIYRGGIRRSLSFRAASALDRDSIARGSDV